MSKLKKMKTKLSITIAIIVLLAFVAVVGTVKADFGSLWDRIANVAGQILGQYLVEQSVNLPPTGMLGTYDESFTNFTKLKATDAFTSEGTTILSSGTTLSGTTAITGTTTVTQSYDGFIVYKAFTMATGTGKAYYKNDSGVDMFCDPDSGIVSSQATGFAPCMVVSLGEAAAATTYNADLLASTTIATSTDTLTPYTGTAPFILDNGNYLTGNLSDASCDSNASTTHFSNWSFTFQLHCWLIGQ